MLERISSSFSSNTTNVCEQNFEIILQGVLKRDMWAMKILDAWGKPLPSGILSGHVHWMGNYDECLQQIYLPTNKSFVSQPINTQYCTLLPKPPLSITLGLCVPSSCNQKSIASLIEILFKNSSITENDLICSNDPPYGQQSLARGAIITCIVLSLLVLIVLSGTIVDIILSLQHQSIDDNITSHINGYNHFSDTDISKFKLIQVPQNSTSRITFLTEFSAIRTLRRIVTMKIKNNDDSFLFINGIRVLSLCWVIISHSIPFGLSYTNNIVDVIVWTRNIAFQLIINATLSVDTFFVLSGFLTAVLFIRQIQKEKKLSFRLLILYYIHRYIRLTPVLLLMILVSINLTPYFGQGPVYPTQKGFESDDCRYVHWWTSILYTGNFINSHEMCLGITWYLHNDMQFHWIAPLALIPFVLGRKSISFIIATLFVLIGIGSILGILLYYPDMSVDVLEAFVDKPGPTFYKNIYITPWCRISAYAVGLITGFIVSNVGREYRLNKTAKIFGTILIIILTIICLFATYPDYILASGLNRSIVVAYQSLSRTSWAIVIGWILFLCSTHQGGILNKFLSWPIWAPLARLNYSCYLVHSTVLHTMIYSQRMPFFYQAHLVVNNFISQIFFSYVAAIFVTIFFETPFFQLGKKLFKR
ncbi:unnamed protein product [Adineta steineri]|uniref:Nose resistant-to-fluoxetine protein N-terminal domain-containing protein n=1 Tax=Adineta steineri TaxID=433720 RepID=A0A813NZA1_9BILA|nr:unnamed protein product [Adineta steineri]CAF3638982.1 unnamed protein product [Adineta steineri]